MRIYLETNFVQELVLLQAESDACETILKLCEDGKTDLVVPAFSIVEPSWKLKENKTRREEFRAQLQKDLGQLKRTSGYDSEIQQIKHVDTILSRIIDEEHRRSINVHEQLFKLADFIPLDSDVLTLTTESGPLFPLFKRYTDLVVCASVIRHLDQFPEPHSYFLNKDKADFFDPIVEKEFVDRNCVIVSSFTKGLNLVLTDLSNS